MTRAVLIALLILAPTGAFAATYDASRSLVLSESPTGNAYLMGGDLTVAAPVSGDLYAAAGTVLVSAPLAADAALLGGTVVVGKPVSGDLRAIGGRVRVLEEVSGDAFLVGGSIEASARAQELFAAGAEVSITGGSQGPVTVYGASVKLGGEFAGDVTVTASDGVTLTSGTVIHGALRYNAPQEADIPADVVVDGGVKYTGSSYLPTSEEAQNFAIVAAALFFIVRILAALLAVGILAGLFPSFSQAVADAALSRSLVRFLLLALLGFAIMVATPVLIVILLVTFAGAALASLLLVGYLLLMLVGYFFSAVVAGALLARGVRKRSRVLWRDAVLGMLALSLIALVPVAGLAVFMVLFAVSVGAIALLFYRFAFGGVSEDDWNL